MCGRVVHVLKHSYDVYIGRGGPECIWGNPYTHRAVYRGGQRTPPEFRTKSVQEALEKYRDYVMSRVDLIELLPTLKNKVLGCWCKLKPDDLCHGDILLELIELFCPD